MPRPSILFRASALQWTFTLLLCAVFLGLRAMAAETPEAGLARVHRETGQAMDRLYYNAGHRVDLALFDFEEMARQGRPAPAAPRRRAESADRAMRQRWLALERRRAALNKRRLALPPDASHTLRIEDLEAGTGDAGWFGARWMRLEWNSGAVVSFAPSDFKGAVVVPGYKYLVEPSDAAFIYGKGSGQYAMIAGFEVPGDAVGDATLVISGLDDDKPGRTRIRITVDGASIFEGENPFASTEWTEHRFPVPAGALRSVSGGRSDAARLRDDFVTFRHDVETFGAWAKRLADAVDAETANIRAGLVYEPASFPPDFWRQGFLRGVCTVPFEQDRDHLFKSFRHLGANMVYSYAGLYNKPSEIPATLAKADELGLPYVQFTYAMRNEERDRLYLGDPAKMLASARAFLRETAGDSGVPVQLAVDEPNFRDTYATDPDVLHAFRTYMQGRRSVLADAGVTVPKEATPVVTMTSPADRPLWMEWQMFKTAHMGSNYRRLWDGLLEDGRFPFVIVQDHRTDDPQQASHVTMGRALPLLSVDLYSNGTVREALVMDLVNNAATDRAILTAGAGYSDKTPDRFRRSLAVGMAHADGVLQWTDIYFNKYRDPRAFWQTDVDDRGRSILTNWRPEYWAIMEEEYTRMADAGRYLGNTESAAPVAVLFSERTAISDSATVDISYFATTQGLYSDLLRGGRPLDARYTENLTSSVLARYRVLFLPDARVLTSSETNLLRAWVRAGGTLIATGASTLCDEWGRPREDFELADVFGAHYEGEATGAKTYRVDKDIVPYNPAAGYARVSVAPGAQTLGAWDTGDPALIRNDYGRGRSYLFTGRKHFARASGPSAAGGLYGAGHPTERALITRLVDEAVGVGDIRVENAPDGLEVQIRKTPDGATVLHFTDWMDGRTVKDLRLRVNRPGKWRVFHPTGKREMRTFTGPRTIAIRPFRIHEMIVIAEE